MSSIRTCLGGLNGIEFTLGQCIDQGFELWPCSRTDAIASWSRTLSAEFMLQMQSSCYLLGGQLALSLSFYYTSLIKFYIYYK